MARSAGIKKGAAKSCSLIFSSCLNRERKPPVRPASEISQVKVFALEKEGYVGVAYGDLKLASVKLERGVARIDFTREIRSDYNPGDLQTLRFQEAVVKTAKQFPSVKKVIVCVNGLNEFGIGLVLNEAVPCRRKK